MFWRISRWEYGDGRDVFRLRSRDEDVEGAASIADDAARRTMWNGERSEGRDSHGILRKTSPCFPCFPEGYVIE